MDFNPAVFFSNVAELIRAALHPGAHAGFAHFASQKLDEMAADAKAAQERTAADDTAKAAIRAAAVTPAPETTTNG